MTSAVDPMSDRPIFKQIADELRRRIESGELAPGDKLPSESELVNEFGAAQGTVRSALNLLRQDGIVQAQHGRGVFVRTRPKTRRLAYDRFARRHREAGKAAFLAEAEREGATARVELRAVGREKASSKTADWLGVRQGAPVLVRRRRYFIDGQPTEFATSYIPWKIADGTPMTEPNTGPGGIYARIEEAGHRLDRFTEQVGARMPTPAETKELRLGEGTPVITLLRIAYDTDGTPVEACDTVMSAEHFLLDYELPAD